MKRTRQQYRGQQGAVSLFVVVFATLLMIIITIGFIQLMLKDQRQATASDLSQSAYDSAQSGVEDAKRLLLLEQACDNGITGTYDCDEVRAAISSNECNTVSTIFGNDDDTETLIQQDEGDKALQQAYTCIKITPDTLDYRGVVALNQSNILPLKGVSEFDSIVIEWFTRKDISAATNAMEIAFPSPAVKLPPVGDRWDVNYPALMRTQFMQTGNTFRLSEFDAPVDGKSNANTLFLYPAIAGASDTTPLHFDLSDPRRDPNNAPEQVRCMSSFTASDIYACKVKINLPAPIDGNTTNRNAFLRLDALYNGAHYKIQLFKAGNPDPVRFDSVQPEVDSTGRANDMFRRVKSRIEFKSDFLYPEAAVDIEGDLCKNFSVTDKDSEYENSSSCTP